MELYRIEAKKVDHGWMITSPAFGITVDAGDDELESGVKALKRLMADEAQARLDKGLFLPVNNKLEHSDIDTGNIVMYVETDFGGRFIARTSETVRRNISMPAWMDLRLRANNIDASRLFQDAAVRKLEELERTSSYYQGITNVLELENICSDEVLDAYFEIRARRELDELKKKRG